MNDDEYDGDGDGDGDEIPVVCQLGIVSAVLGYLSRCKFELNKRHLNAIIAGVNEMMVELDRPSVPATPGMGLAAWIQSDATGLSSRYMARVLASYCKLDDVRVPEERLELKGIHFPHDPADFGRCVGLLDAVPEFRLHDEILLDPVHGKEWNGLIGKWEELEALYREESPSGSAPRLLAEMRKIINS
jgi:hypothetical protein